MVEIDNFTREVNAMLLRRKAKVSTGRVRKGVGREGKIMPRSRECWDSISKHELRPILRSDSDQKLVKRKSMVEVV